MQQQKEVAASYLYPCGRSAGFIRGRRLVRLSAIGLALGSHRVGRRLDGGRMDGHQASADYVDG